MAGEGGKEEKVLIKYQTVAIVEILVAMLVSRIVEWRASIAVLDASYWISTSVSEQKSYSILNKWVRDQGIYF